MARKATLTLIIGGTRQDIDLTLKDGRSGVDSDALPDENIWLEVDGERIGSIFVTRDDDEIVVGLGRYDDKSAGWDYHNPIAECDEARAFERYEAGE